MNLPTPELVIAAATVILCGSALIFGSRNERLGGVFCLLSYASSLGLGMVLPPLPATLGFLFCDGLCLVGFLYLCWKAPHPWPLWAFGLQLLAFMADALAVNLKGLVLKSTLATLHGITGCLILLCLFVGVLSVFRSRPART